MVPTFGPQLIKSGSCLNCCEPLSRAHVSFQEVCSFNNANYMKPVQDSDRFRSRVSLENMSLEFFAFVGLLEVFEVDLCTLHWLLNVRASFPEKELSLT